jgi:hypothetical protein
MPNMPVSFVPVLRLLLLALLLLGLAGAQGARANGWEHWGIPLDVLLDLLDSEDSGYRIRAARSLGIRGEQRAFDPILARLRDSQEPAVVKEALLAARALGEAGAGHRCRRTADCPHGGDRCARQFHER